MSEDIFTKRGITPGGRVAHARGYRPYPAGDGAFEAWKEIDGRLLRMPRGWQTAIKAHPGWAMPRHAVMPDDPTFGVDPVAQLRPEEPVSLTPPWGHDHDGMTHRAQNCPCGFRHRADRFGNRVLGKVRHSQRIYTGPAFDPWRQAPITGEALARHLAKDVMRGGHSDENGRIVIRTEGIHVHSRVAKYVFTANVLNDPELDPELASSARRLDTNPLIRASGYVAPEGLFILCLEGQLKTDAVVEAGWPAVGVPSVTLWDVERNPDDDDLDFELEVGDFSEECWVGGPSGPVHELHRFAWDHLRGTPTVVIVDSDWSTNEAVRKQAEYVVGRLKTWGVPAIAAAPPEGPCTGFNDPVTGRRLREKRGIDDWLGEVLSKELDIEGLAPFEARHEALLRCVARPERIEIPAMPGAEARLRAALHPQAVPSALAAVRDLASRVDVDGYAAARTEEMADRLGVHRTTVWRGLSRAVGVGVVKPVAESWPEHVNGRVRERAALYHVPGAPPPPTLTLGQWLASHPQVPLEGATQ